MLFRLQSRNAPGETELRSLAGRGCLPYLHELARLFVGERLEHHAIDDGENCGRGPDAERERQHGHGAEAGVFQQLAEGEFQIVHGSLSVVSRP